MRATDAGQRAGRLRTRAVLFLIVAVGAGALAVMLVRQYLTSVQRTVSRLEQPTQPVVVAAMDVPTATKLEAKHLRIAQWPTGGLPSGSFAKLDDLVGRAARQDVFAGEVFMRSKLVDDSQGQGLASLLAPGLRAMAVKIDPVVGVAGFVHPGDYVDVISTMQPDDETNELRREEAAWVSRIVLQHVRVLAVGDRLSAVSQKNEPVPATVFTLAVTPEQSETLALANQYGKLQLALRSRADTAVATTTGQSPAMLLASDAPPKAAAEGAAAPAPAPRARRREPEEQPADAKPAPPPAPVVEILRGTRVEERKLHSATAPEER